MFSVMNNDNQNGNEAQPFGITCNEIIYYFCIFTMVFHLEFRCNERATFQIGFIRRHQNIHGPIEFLFNHHDDTIRNIFSLFGAYLLRLTVHFRRSLNMSIFVNERNALNNIHVLTIQLNIRVDDVWDQHFEFYADIEGIFANSRLIFQRSITSIIAYINADQVPTLQQLNFRFSVTLTPYTYRYREILTNYFNEYLESSFQTLRRGNMEQKVSVAHDDWVLIYIVKFNF